MNSTAICDRFPKTEEFKNYNERQSPSTLFVKPYESHLKGKSDGLWIRVKSRSHVKNKVEQMLSQYPKVSDRRFVIGNLDGFYRNYLAERVSPKLSDILNEGQFLNTFGFLGEVMLSLFSGDINSALSFIRHYDSTVMVGTKGSHNDEEVILRELDKKKQSGFTGCNILNETETGWVIHYFNTIRQDNSKTANTPIENLFQHDLDTLGPYSMEDCDLNLIPDL